MHCLMGKNTIIFYTRQTIPVLGKCLHGLSDTIFFLSALDITFFLYIIWLFSLQYLEVASQLQNCQLHLSRLRIHSCYCCFCWHLGEIRTRKAQGLWADAMRSINLSGYSENQYKACRLHNTLLLQARSFWDTSTKPASHKHHYKYRGRKVRSDRKPGTPISHCSLYQERVRKDRNKERGHQTKYVERWLKSAAVPMYGDYIQTLVDRNASMLNVTSCTGWEGKHTATGFQKVQARVGTVLHGGWSHIHHSSEGTENCPCKGKKKAHEKWTNI